MFMLLFAGEGATMSYVLWYYGEGYVVIAGVGEMFMSCYRTYV